MRIEINYQGTVNPVLEEKIRIAMMRDMDAKQFSRGFRKDEVFLWFDYQEKGKKRR